MNIKSSTPEAPRTESAREDNVVRLLDRRLPAADQIYKALRDDIISGRFRPAEAISENRVCGLFGVSRSPVRIALTRLVEDGLIDIFPQRGSFVAPIKLQEVREGHFTRVALELAVLGEAARYWSPKESMLAKATIDLQRRFASEGDAWSFHTADEQFHRGFAVCARLEGVWNTIQGAKTHLDRIRHLANPVKGHMDKVISEHEAVIEHLDHGDAKGAIGAMQQHLDSLHTTIARLKPLHEDYFVED